MRKYYYDEKEIWKKLMEELSEIDIDDELYYFFKEYEFCFSAHDYGIYQSDIERIHWLFEYQAYDELQIDDFEIIENIGKYIKENDLYCDMMEAKKNLLEYEEKNIEPDDEEITKLTIKFEITSEIYLWCKYVFAEVVKTIRKLLNDSLSTINEIYELI